MSCHTPEAVLRRNQAVHAKTAALDPHDDLTYTHYLCPAGQVRSPPNFRWPRSRWRRYWRHQIENITSYVFLDSGSVVLVQPQAWQGGRTLWDGQYCVQSVSTPADTLHIRIIKNILINAL